ncbi:hypothetical protein SLEP1_g27857 [Rubroshorea leprosula]|uniref:Uncharacterized protein n=1 Tax=Rubroshorea leprosula TaxID=152421 RepID=A0AAV5K0H1_9ROSI|nr:hypothetical protein SLEP1_g27857 [Rubroshorea leprosula]
MPRVISDNTTSSSRPRIGDSPTISVQFNPPQGGCLPLDMINGFHTTVSKGRGVNSTKFESSFQESALLIC